VVHCQGRADAVLPEVVGDDSMSQLFIVLGVVFLSFALRTLSFRLARKAGALGFLVASFLVFHFATGSVVAGFGGVALWFLVPWAELLTRIRRLRLPVEVRLSDVPPPKRTRFPELSELSAEVEEEGFELVADKGWEWEATGQFHRIFHHPGLRLQAVLTLTEQHGLSWGSMTITSRNPGGLVYHTSNLPFSSPMKLAPEVMVRQVLRAEHFNDLLEEHQHWMWNLALEPEDLVETPPEELPRLMELETARQIRYNLETGLICLADSPGTFRYSWRGLFFLYFRLLRDMVKLC